ncbi:MAG: DNA cytosine methyltransferase, partial [Deltaproteobacteria bacterium]|nr:DNA cytosine methyltransferase [Deltaproteobacteria bacterium]
MPTLLEKLQKAKAAGVPDAEVKERLAELGIDPVADADLAYDAAKAAGAARKAAKDAKDADFARNSGYAPVVFKGVMGSPYLGRRPSPNPLKGTPVPKVEFADIPDEKVLSARAADHLTKDWLARKAFDKFVEAAPDAGEEFELPHVKVATALPKAYGAIKGISGSPVGSGKDDESLLGTLLAYGPKITPSGMGGTIIPTDASREMDKRLAAAMTEARAKGLPTLSPRVWKAAVEQEAQWKTRRLPEGTLAGAAQLAGNLGVDVAEAFVGLAELLNELGGITVVPKDQTLTQKMERGEKWGEAVGAGLVGGPIAVVAGMDKPFGESVWAEAPFSAWTMFADPAAQIAKFPKVQAATGRFAQVLTRKFLRDKAGLPNMPADILATIERVLVNGAKQADARATAILEQMMHNADAARAAIKNLAELIARQMAKAAKKGKRPQPVQPEVSPVDLAIVPRGDQSARKAAQADVGVARAAEAQAGVAAADMQAMADAVAPRSTETAMAKPEGLPHITDVRLDDALASIENIRNQAERLGDTDAYAKANDIHAALAAEKDRRKVAAERGDYGPTGDPVFDAAQAKVAEAVAKAEAAAQKTVSAELAAESAGVLPQVEAGTVWVPRDKVPGVAVPADQAFTIPNLQRNFGIGKTVATATMAIAKAVGVDTSKIRLTKGGTPGAGALEQKPRGVSLFSGGGLVEEGLRGIVDPIAAVEMDTRIAAHHGKAHGSTVINRDVRDVDFGQFDGIDHLHASPVCKSFSKAKANAAELPLDIETAKATARAIREAKPRYFTLENVPEYAKSEAVRLIVGELDKQGYKHDVAVYDSADYGAPTHRKRLLLRAWREGEAPPPKATPTHGPKAGTPYADWFSTIEDLLPSQEPSALAPWQVQRLAGKGLKQGEAYLVMGGS